MMLEVGCDVETRQTVSEHFLKSVCCGFYYLIIWIYLVAMRYKKICENIFWQTLYIYLTPLYPVTHLW